MPVGLRLFVAIASLSCSGEPYFEVSANIHNPDYSLKVGASSIRKCDNFGHSEGTSIPAGTLKIRAGDSFVSSDGSSIRSVT